MTNASLGIPNLSNVYDDHHDKSREAQRRADRWLMSGTIVMGTAILGSIGFPLFLRGLVLSPTPCFR